MGQCGCGDFSPDYVYKLGDHVIVLSEYHGCQDCDTPLECVMFIMTVEEAKSWCIEEDEMKSIELNEFGWAEEIVPFVGRDELIKAAEEIEEEGELFLNNYATLADILCDYGLDLLQRAMNHRPILKLKEE